MPATTVAISSQTRKKLKTFHYNEKENEQRLLAGKRVDNDGSYSSANKLSPQQTNLGSKPPQTPGDRIPLADLTANPEDWFNRAISATPKERIEWKDTPRSSASSCSKPQHNRKRARSSSPSSCSQSRRSKHFAKDADPLDLQSIGRSLHTPKQDDPLLALWDRYADTRERHGNNATPLNPPPMSSSPHTPNGVKQAEGLRRTASCGIEWPMSTTKHAKRQEKDPYSRSKGIFAARKDAILAKGLAKHSRITLLVDSMHDSLLKNQVSEIDAPSSSSPLPERHGDLPVSPVLPRSYTLQNADVGSEFRELRGFYQDDNDKSSDYGAADFDLDDSDFVKIVEQAESQFERREPTRPPSPPVFASRPSVLPPQLRQEQSAPAAVAVHLDPSPKSREKPALSTVVTRVTAAEDPSAEKDPSDESFGELDDELASQLAELVDEIDSQAVAKPDPAPLPPPLDASAKPDARDEFDETYDDEYDDNDNAIWNEILPTSATSEDLAVGSKTQKSQNKAIKRYLIVKVYHDQYVTSQGHARPQKLLSIKDDSVKKLYTIKLRQSWYDTRCIENSYVHLIGDLDQNDECIVDDQYNMIILHPDHLISATVVADSFTCTRRAVLQDRIKATSPAEPPQVYGQIIHEVFGEALRQNEWEMANLKGIVLKLIPSYIESLYEINIQTSDAVEYVMSKMPELKAWASVFVGSNLVANGVIHDRNGALVSMAINKLLELEEHVWSPMYGLKGNIDATVQVRMQLPGEVKPKTLTVPLELKTGKRDSNETHRAQTALYTLLLSDRYDINVTSGILYYLETSKTFRVQGLRNEIRHMIIQRNELACYVHDKLALPSVIRKEHLCKKCYAQTACFAYHKLVEGGDGESSGLKGLFEEAVRHLDGKQQSFFKKWDDLLTKEERDSMKFKRELWTMLSSEREAVGRCFSGVIIDPGSAIEHSDRPKIMRYTYSFVKGKAQQGFSFSESQITVGEPIVVSDEQGHFALANGYVVSVRPNRITVTVDRRLQNARKRQPGFHATDNQVFSAIMQTDGVVMDASNAAADSEAPVLYRLDKDEFANGMATARNNVLKIMERDLWRARELRQLIVDLRLPTFKTVSTAYSLSGPASQQEINGDQRRAIEKVMSARDYALVLGMPGTGKTTTIAHIIRALVSQGKSVLLTSYTHTAVDNILLKIKDDNIPVLRLGALGKVHPDVQAFADVSSVQKKSITELEESWSRSKVVATTCLGVNHAIFHHRKFDYCIVDEASQITLPVCLGPIRFAATFILVGDHYQLPPLVQNKEAQEGGLDVSLFKLLSDAHPSSVVNLEHQYRMAEDIQLLSKELIYSGRLKCGTPSVASRLLHIPNLNAGLEAHHFSSLTSSRSSTTAACGLAAPSCWLEQCLRPENRTIFLNTDTLTGDATKLGAPETVSGSGTRITNSAEAILAAQILTTLVRSGVSPRSIGVITFYRSQLTLLRSTIKSVAGTAAAADLEMHTADKYQGRDKEVILLSCVRSNKSKNVGELLRDWRRVNVALTRARSKLIIIGSLCTLRGSNVGVLQGLCKIIARERWILDLPIDAAQMHFFEGGIQTQTTQQQPQPQPPLEPVARLTPGSHETVVEQGQQEDVASTKAPAVIPKHTRVPLAITSGNAAVRKPFKQPTKVVQGKVDIDRLLNQRPVLRNIIGGNDLKLSSG